MQTFVKIELAFGCCHGLTHTNNSLLFLALSKRISLAVLAHPEAVTGESSGTCRDALWGRRHARWRHDTAPGRARGGSQSAAARWPAPPPTLRTWPHSLGCKSEQTPSPSRPPHLQQCCLSVILHKVDVLLKLKVLRIIPLLKWRNYTIRFTNWNLHLAWPTCKEHIRTLNMTTLLISLWYV